jgi:hypothetical protein
VVAHFAKKRRRDALDHGVLFSAGLITGEALVGIGMAVPIVVFGNPDVLAIFGTSSSNLPGLVLLVLVGFLLWKAGARTKA